MLTLSVVSFAVAVLALIGSLVIDWYTQHVAPPIQDLLSFIRNAVMEMCYYSAIGRGAGQVITRSLANFVHALPFKRDEFLPSVLLLVARFEDDTFNGLVSWKTERDAKEIRDALMDLDFGLNTIERAYPDRIMVIALLKRFRSETTKTLDDLRFGRMGINA